VDVVRHRYAVTGWGVGEVVVAGGIVVAHELPTPSLQLDDGSAVGRNARNGGGTAATSAVRQTTRSGPRPPGGDARPPGNTLASELQRVRAESVSKAHEEDAGEARASGDELENGSPEAAVVADLVARVRAHLAGSPTSYAGIPVDLSWCTDFQRELTRAIREVPWGEIVSYGELAALAGRPGAARAAGSFCAQSRFALIFPCHRVVSSTGIGGYGDSGLTLKRRLLALEGIDL